METKKPTIAIVRHSYTLTGVVEEDLLKYLRDKSDMIYYVTHPFKAARDGLKLESTIDVYSAYKKTHHIIGPAAFGIEPLFFIKDIIYTLWFFISQRKRIDVYFGVDNLNALSGIILKKLGIVKKVVYYTIDLYPNRFPNTYLNSVYHYIDKLCVNHSDETWNLSQEMEKSRKKRFGSNMISGKQYTVPLCVWMNKVKPKSSQEIIFSGHLLPHMGVDMAIEAFALVIKKMPTAQFTIIGSGEELENLKRLVNQLGLKKNVTFLGWVKNRQAFMKKLQSGVIGIAPFNTRILDEKVKIADPGKIKDYMAAGLPVIVTNAVSNASEIEKSKSGIVVTYSKQSIANAMLYLLGDKKRLVQYQTNARRYISQFDCNLIYKKNIDRVLS